jgi:transketolase
MAETTRPSLLILHSHIGHPSPDLTDDPHAHGNPFTAEHVTRTKAVMGIPDEPFWAPDDLVAAYRSHCATRGNHEHDAWRKKYDHAVACGAVDENVWEATWSATGLPGWADALPTFAVGESVATRVAIEQAFNASLDSVPALVAGAADLTGNTGTKLAGQVAQTAARPDGRQVYYGIREHGMGSAMVGMALHGGVLPAGGTFFVFLDYMRPPVRLAALSQAKVVFVFTHDSVGVGEDGPTHQPVEHLATLRAIPGLQVIRPADANETVAAWRACVEHDGPTALVLSRQNIPVRTDGSAVARGAGVVHHVEHPHLVIVATGSEVALSITAAEQLAGEGINARVVSLPSWDRLALQGREYHQELFPHGVPVLSVEAATTFGWERFADHSIGIDRFGASAPGAVALDRLGINVGNLVAAARHLVS